LDDDYDNALIINVKRATYFQIVDPYARYRGLRFNASAAGTPEESEFGPSFAAAG